MTKSRPPWWVTALAVGVFLSAITDTTTEWVVAVVSFMVFWAAVEP